ncbi:hypothetical protein DFJ58DRAFT_778658 [Suillus subalutaceus]|uniref:uncharacterized protein n=1 Tax=Suillus subalutaceus TaxID=48586 RepID=UPI001B883462|nr:uncharacterized protein DFJ58DRAFT_778658 [Suillus subalutaceus]KAG1860722.1 hypothetical protein DFJ58DRAFT_778658 [Suillus subalutaceus]
MLQLPQDTLAVSFSSTLSSVAGFVGSFHWQRRCYVIVSGVGYVIGGSRIMAYFLAGIHAHSAQSKDPPSLLVSTARVLLLYLQRQYYYFSIAYRGSPCTWRCLVPVTDSYVATPLDNCVQ